jgi:CubicO group peptidase (beta-lactamase class C family)
MNSTAFAPRPDMEERLAIPYIVDGNTGRHVPAARTKADVWPAGIVYGTVLDQANWLIVNLNGGEFRGRRLLRTDTVGQMHTRQFEKFAGPMEYGYGNGSTGYGLTWIISERDGNRFFAHSGSVAGYTAFLLGNLDRKLGCAILTNGNRAHRYLARLAEEALDTLGTPAQ